MQEGGLCDAPRRWHPAPTAPEETNTTLWPASCSAATASHSLVIWQEGACEEAWAGSRNDTHVPRLTCDKCMQFLSARNKLEVPTLMTTVCWPAHALGSAAECC